MISGPCGVGRKNPRYDKTADDRQGSGDAGADETRRALFDLSLKFRPDEGEIVTVWREGLPLTAPARTLVDVAGEIQPEQLEMAVWQALGRGLLTARRLEAEARRRGSHDLVGAALEAVTA